MEHTNNFHIILVEKGKQQKMHERAVLIKQLKPGNEIPANPLHADWMIVIIIVAAFLYSLVKSSSKGLFPGFARFFLFRGVNDPSSKDFDGLFHWQSTIFNLVSFLIIALFCFSAASYYNFIPSGIKGNYYMVNCPGNN